MEPGSSYLRARSALATLKSHAAHRSMLLKFIEQLHALASYDFSTLAPGAKSPRNPGGSGPGSEGPQGLFQIGVLGASVFRGRIDFLKAQIGTDVQITINYCNYRNSWSLRNVQNII